MGEQTYDQLWLEQGPEVDPWTLISKDPSREAKLDAFLGNGHVGLRIPAGGEGSTYAPERMMPPSGCMVHGLWTDDKLMVPPFWHGLGLDDSHGPVDLAEGNVSEYSQVLDIKKATLTTQGVFTRNGRSLTLQTRLWLSRSERALLVIEQEFTPDFSGEITVSDRLGAVDMNHDWQVSMGPRWSFSDEPDAIGCHVRMGESFREVSIHSQVIIEHDHRVQTEVVEDPILGLPGISRQFSLNVESGTTYRVLKVAALLDAPLPGTSARDIVAKALADLGQAYQEHGKAWDKRWDHHIQVGNPRLQQLINASLYQCYAQLPDFGTPGLGPVGLSGNAWFGRTFWDADLWTFPVVALLHPDLGRTFTAYRAQTLDGARRNAAARGYTGACWSWESAETGDEKVPYPPVHHQRHVNACVALAQWWDLLISGDKTYFTEHGASIIIESARYFASRVVYNDSEKRYELRHIYCPDEFAGIQDNNATTNYACVQTLRMAQQACATTGQDPDPQWQAIIDGMWIPFDDEANCFIEYEGFNRFGEYDSGRKCLKQADTTLLVYPWAKPMSDTCKKNTLSYYRSLYGPNKIMMAAAIDGIVDCELGDGDKAWETLCDLLPHVRGPFMLMSESPVNDIMSFITGIGGLLQLLVMGFAGLRLTDDGPTFQPCLPKQVGGMTINGLHSDGVPHRVDVHDGEVSVEPLS